MKNYLLFFYLLPLFVFPQKTNYTTEQEQIVDKIVFEINNSEEINYDLFIANLNNGLDRVPYHPDLVYQLLRVYSYGQDDFQSASSYCQRLDKNYLLNNQNILVEFCASSFFLVENYEKVHSLLPLINEQKNKDLYNALYYIEIKELDKGIEYVLKCLNHDYTYQSQIILKYYIINRMIMDLYLSDRFNYLNKIITENREQFRSFKLELEAFVMLIESAIIDGDYKLVEDLISESIIRFPQFFKYMTVYNALIYSKKGKDLKAIKAMEKALKFDETAFTDILNEKDGLNIFANYILTLNNLSKYKDKVQLSMQMLDFFKGKELFTLKIKLYQSVLFASKDLDKAQTILDSSNQENSQKNHENFNQLLKIQNELYKENPDYKLVNQMLYNFKNNLSEIEFLMLIVDYKYTVNIAKNSAYFEPKKMVQELDQLIEITEDEEQLLKYRLQKIQTIATYDFELANKELDRLGIAENERLYYLNREFKKQSSTKENESSDDVKGIKKFYKLNSIFIDFVMNAEINNQ